MSYKDFHVKNGIIVDTGNKISVGNSTVNTVITSTTVTIAGTQVSYGYTGSVGYVGSRGVIGYTGSEGAYAAIGFTGSVGSPGGYTGSQGTLGYTGSRGFSGSLGFTGSQGAYDAIGFTGSKGTDGATGWTGSQSTVVGYTGSVGPIGLGFTWRGTWSAGTTYYVNDVVWYTNASYVCIAQASGSGQSPVNGSYWTIIAAQGNIGFGGSQGYTGSQGVQGNPGVDGTDGTNGTNGADGATGWTGSLGWTGSQGSGYTGSASRAFERTDTGNSPDSPVAGDEWLDGTTGILYVYIVDENGSHWVELSPASQGYTGSLGYDGSRGYTGSQGNQGTTGWTGSQSTVIGYTGSLGFTGSVGVGYTGSQSTVIGYTGSRGYNGSQGPIGYTGSQSTVIGYTGSQGAIGVSSAAANGYLDVTPSIRVCWGWGTVNTSTSYVTFAQPFSSTAWAITATSNVIANGGPFVLTSNATAANITVRAGTANISYIAIGPK